MFAMPKTPFWRSKYFLRASAVLLVAILVIGLVRPANAAIAYRSASSGNNAGGTTSLTINTPAGAAVGDVLIFSGDVRDTSSALEFVGSLGWVQVNYSNNGTITKHTFYRVLTATPPSSYTFSIENGTSPVTAKASGGIIAYSGVDTSNPIHTQAIQAYASSTTSSAPSITTTIPNAMVVALYGTATGTTSTQGSGMTERYDDASTSNGATSRTTSAGQDAVQASAGVSGIKTMTMASGAAHIGHTIALTPAPVVSQAGYRWFANSTTAGTVGSPLASQDTMATAPAPGQPFRLRMLLGVTELQLPVATAYKLQYMWQSSGACPSTGSYSDITASTALRYYDNSGASDGAAIVTSANDPVRSGVTKVTQTYEESNNFTVATAIPVNQDGMWDFALTLANDAEESGRYCVRAVAADGGVLGGGYNHIPSLALTTKPSSIRGQEHRFFQNTDAATPGSSLGSTNSAVTLGSTGNQFRLRAGLMAPGYYKQLTSGGRHTCGISSEKKAYCWGDDSNGQLGNDTTLAGQQSPVAVNMNGVLSGKSIVSIVAGYDHTCALTSDNNIYCWGSDSSGQLGSGVSVGNQPTAVNVDMAGALSGKTISSIYAGGDTSCALTSDGLAYCWGSDSNGQLGNDITQTSQNSPVAVDMTGVLSGKTISSISIGSSHTCAIASDNLAYCWGSDGAGQRGNGATTGSEGIPAAVDTSGVLSGKSILSINAGGIQTCAIASDNLAYCWGSDTWGQLGNDVTLASQSSPVAVATGGVMSGLTIKSISGGYAHTCAVASNNLVYCWGFDSSGQLGDDALLLDEPRPVAVDTSGALAGKSINSISMGWYHSCAMTSDNKPYCWGSDTNSELGNGATTGNQTAPVLVDLSNALTAKTVTGMAIGNGWSCALATNLASCWGSDVVGQLGDNADSVSQTSAVPVNTAGVLSGKTILSIAGKKDHACVIANDNLGYCWGGDAEGQLGNDVTLANQRTPVAVSTSGALSGKTLKSISAGGAHTCAIGSDDLAYCWGDDSSGQLGNDATLADQATPVAVSTSGVLAGKTILSISAGELHTCVIASDNQAYCWGTDFAGQLGDGATFTGQPTPVAVTTSGVLSGKTILKISSGHYITCVVASDNQAYCWGSDSSGALGNGTATVATGVPNAVDTSGVLSGKTVLDVSAGNTHGCVIASDNLAYCWGGNFNGDLGRGTSTNSEISPGAVLTSGALAGKTILKIYSGLRANTCAVASDNKAYCWGRDYEYQLGDNTIEEDQWAPVPVSDTLLSTPHLTANSLAAKLYYAQKTAPTCQAQTGFIEVTNATAIAYHDNASVTNGSMMVHGTNNPVTNSSIMPQTYYDSLPTSITNQNMVTHVMTNLWDFSLKDNGAPASTTYCLRLVGSAGEDFGWYDSYPEITTAAASGGGGEPTLDQMTRGGQSVINGIKNLFSW
jgi:alpha-tubulin suppressor-like RCC1 family protein